MLLSLFACQKRWEEVMPNGDAEKMNVLKLWTQQNALSFPVYQPYARGTEQTAPFEAKLDETVFLKDAQGNDVALVPLHRKLSVTYNQQVAFVRRLRVSFSLDDDQNLIINDAKIVEVGGTIPSLEQAQQQIASLKPDEGNFMFVHDADHQLLEAFATVNQARQEVNTQMLEGSNQRSAGRCMVMTPVVIVVDCGGSGGSTGGGTAAPTDPSSGGGDGGAAAPTDPGSGDKIVFGSQMKGLCYSTIYTVGWGDCPNAGSSGGGSGGGNGGGPGGGSPVPPPTTTNPPPTQPSYPDKPDEPLDDGTNLPDENFSDPDGILKGYEEDLNEKEKILQEMIGKKSPIKLKPDQKDIIKNVLLPEYAKAKAELAEIKAYTKAKFVIKIDASLKKGQGAVAYNPKTNKIEVRFGAKTKNQTPLTAHELKHIYQYIKGKISFDKTTGGAGILYDLQDEVEAYTRQYIFDIGLDCGTLNIDGKPSPNYKIDVDEVMRIGSVENPNIYENFKDRKEPREMGNLYGLIVVEFGTDIYHY